MKATERIVVVLTKQQKATLSRRASAMQLSLAEYIRRAALGDADTDMMEKTMSSAEAAIKRANRSLDATFARMEARAMRRDAGIGPYV